MPLIARSRPARAGLRLALGAVASAGVGVALSSASCGARTELFVPPPPPECRVDADCPGFGDLCSPVYCKLEAPPKGSGAGTDAGAQPRGGTCEPLTPVDCDDGDVCTADVCEPETGACSHPPATLDSDDDGFRAPRPGTLAGEPDACGDDCDDASPVAFPGGLEVCDGVDNDCNGVVDDGAAFVPADAEAIRISGDIDPASAGGLAYSGELYAALYGGGGDMFLSMLEPSGEKVPPGEKLVTQKNADASGGPLVWTGDRFGYAWQDRRFGDYETYFSLLDGSGTKVLPDLRLSSAPGFSVNVALAWNGTEFLAAWQDRREGPDRIFGQRINVDGAPVGENLRLTDASSLDQEAPVLAAGTTSVGLAWTSGSVGAQVVRVRILSPELEPLTPAVSLTSGSSESVYPTIVWNQDRYVVAWYDKTASPKAIYAAAVAEDGSLLAAPRPITDPGPFRSRSPFLRALGDRLLVLYADDRDQNQGYELYARTVSSLLEPLSPEIRLTFAPRDSLGPVAAFGPEGDVGILFRDDREGGAHHVYFTRLSCLVAQ